MDKKTIFVELPVELIDKIDRTNTCGDRSSFIADLLDKQIDQSVSRMNASTDLTTRMEELKDPLGLSGEISIVNNRGVTLGKFDVNSVDDFKKLAEKIGEISDDPVVRMRTQRWR